LLQALWTIIWKPLLLHALHIGNKIAQGPSDYLR
jgi:hypothetical protein